MSTCTKRRPEPGGSRPGRLELVANLAEPVRRANYRLELVVWTPTPAESACARSATLAHGLCAEVAGELALDADARGRIAAVARPWRQADIRRPAFSVVVVRMKG